MQRLSKQDQITSEAVAHKLQAKKLQSSSHGDAIKNNFKKKSPTVFKLQTEKTTPITTKKKNIEKESKTIKKKKTSNIKTKKIEKLLKEPIKNKSIDLVDETDQWKIKKKIIQIIDKKGKTSKNDPKKSAKSRENKFDEKHHDEIKKRPSGKEFLYYRNLTPFKSSLECEKIVKECGKLALAQKMKEEEEKRERAHTADKRRKDLYLQNKKEEKLLETNTYMRGLKTISQNLKDIFKPNQDFKNILQNKKDDKEIDVVFSRAASAPSRLKSEQSNARVKSSKIVSESSKATPAIIKTLDSTTRNKKKTKEKLPKEKTEKEKVKEKPEKETIIKEKISSEQKVNKHAEKPLKKKNSKDIKIIPLNKPTKEETTDTSDRSSLPRKIFPIIEVEQGKAMERPSALARSSVLSQRKSEDSNNSYFSFQSK